MKKYILIDIGCHECGVDSEYKGIFDSEEEAQKEGKKLSGKRDGGQTIAQVFEIDI